MAKKWSLDEDCHVLRWHSVSIADHDINMSRDAVISRLSTLTKNGARAKYAEMMLNALEFEALAGRKHFDFDGEVKYWEKELAIGLSAIMRLNA